MSDVTVSRPWVDLARGRARALGHMHAMGGVLALAAFLNCYRLEQNGDANTYYAGAVHSMLRSFGNFFFGSFDSGGLQTVDKPPLAFWVEAASAKVFGISSLSLLLPEAIAGVLAVWLLYLVVARAFGRTAGVVAALALAVSPVSVAIDRDNNPDALFVLLLVVAAYCGLRAVQDGRLRWLLWTAVAIGLAFNTKMLVALVVLPGIGLAYLLLAPRTWRVRLWHLLAATVALVVVSGWWIAAVALTPAANRPWISGTSSNSALSLVFGYNGFGRVTGQTGGTSFGGGGGVLFSGTPGPLRLINDAMGDQGGWLLPFAILAGIAALVLALRARDRLRLAALVIVGGWFLAGAVVFSYAGGIVHTYYVSAIAPPIAGLVGIGAVELARAARGVRARRVLLPVAAAAIGLTAWLEVVLVRRAGYMTWLVEVIVAASAVAVLGLGLALRRSGIAAPAIGARARRAAAGARGVGAEHPARCDRRRHAGCGALCRVGTGRGRRRALRRVRGCPSARRVRRVRRRVRRRPSGRRASGRRASGRRLRRRWRVRRRRRYDAGAHLRHGARRGLALPADRGRPAGHRVDGRLRQQDRRDGRVHRTRDRDERRCDRPPRRGRRRPLLPARRRHRLQRRDDRRDRRPRRDRRLVPHRPVEHLGCGSDDGWVRRRLGRHAVRLRGQGRRDPGGRLTVRSQIVRYCAVGVLNTLVSLVVDALLLALGAPVLVASAVGFTAGICSGYSLNRRFTFGARASATAGGLYLAVGVCGLALDTGLVRILSDAGAGAFASFLLALPLVTLATFGANRRLTFREEHYA